MGVIIKNLTHVYNEGLPHSQLALDDVSVEIEDGEFIGVIGHTGSGKSTLLQHLNGLLKPKSGKIIINDCDITMQGVNMREIRKRVGLVFQYPEYQLFEETVKKDVAYGPMNLGVGAEEAELMAREALELVGLDYDQVAERSPFELSGGQKRRAAIAGVVAMNPEVLILDEPTAGLDPKAHDEVLNMVQRLHREKGNITILVSHNMEDIAAYCDKIIVMEKGKLVMHGTAKEIFANKQRLDSIGLELPKTMKLLHELRNAGGDVPVDLFALHDVEEAIYEMIKRKNKGC